MKVSPRLGRATRLVFAAAAIGFLIAAFADTYDRTADVLPSWWRLALAEVFALAGLWFAGRSWLALFDDVEDKGPLLGAFYTAQVAKYVPGGVWQAVGQIGMSTRAGISIGRASTAFAVHALTNVAAGGTVGATLVLGASRPAMPLRLLSLLGLAPIALLHRGWMRRAVALVRRLIRRGAGDEVVPPQAAILRSYVWCLGTFFTAGVAFGLVVSAEPRGWSIATAVAAFGLAWTAGFLALPFPSGLGVREGVLIAIAGSQTAATVIAASAIHRLVTIVAEVISIVVSRRRSRSPAAGR